MRLGIAAVLLAATAGACGGDDSSSGTTTAGSTSPSTDGTSPSADSTSPSGNTTEAPEGEAKDGGTLTMVVGIDAASLDPIVGTVGGYTGGIEMQAIYDTLLRYNPDTKEYEPRIAESIESNADATVWTLKLRDGVKFSDGTPYDAEAVRLSFARHMSALNTQPSRTYLQSVSAVDVIDPLTVQFTLSTPWATFPAVLASSPGMVPSPTAYAAACGDKNPRECSFGLQPVGAGPFVIDAFTPGDSITMTRNDTYWGDKPHLDGLKFISTGNDYAASLETVKSDAAQAAFLRGPVEIAEAKDEGLPGYSNVEQSGTTLMFNNGVVVTCKDGAPAVCAGKPDGPFVPPSPTQNLKVRQAIAAAIDTDQINQRIADGKGLPGTQLLQDSFPYYPDVAGQTYDLDKAKQLVEEAKAEGWDGKIRYACGSGTLETPRAVVIQSMLEAAGMDVTVNMTDLSTFIQNTVVQRDFDIACWGITVGADDLPYATSILGNLSSTSTRSGYKSAKMDAAIDQLRAAATPAEKTAAWKAVSENYIADVPQVTMEAIESYIVWGKDVHGIYANESTMVYFDKAWIGD